MDLADVDLATFAQHVGSAFAVAGGPVLTLVTAEALPAPPGDRGRPPFRLAFEGPADRALEQRTWPLSHEALGTLEVFVVPIGRVEDRLVYEAVFT